MKSQNHVRVTRARAFHLLFWVATTLSSPATAAAPPIAFAGTAWDQAARAQGLAPELLYALALARSGTPTGEGSATPWPWTLVLGGQPHHYPSRAHATAALAQLHHDQRNTLELGLMAIDFHRWRHRLATPAPADLLEPATNLRLGAAILADSLRATPSDQARAVGQVVAPADPSAARTVGRRVLAIAIALGMTTSAGAAAPAAAPHRPGAAHVRPLIAAAARRHGLDPAFALAVAHTESHFNQAARSPKGARGVMQLMPATAARYQANAADLMENIDAGVRYLRDLAVRFDGDPALVAAAYNAGEHAVLRHRRQIPPYRETQAYVPRVLAAREAYRCTSHP